MLEHLFGSKTRVKLLRTFFQQPAQPFFVRELTRLIDTQINAVRREIDLLLSIGLIKEIEHRAPASDVKAGAQLRKYYMLNTDASLYPELHALLLKGESLGEQHMIDAIREKAGDVRLLLLTGRFTGEKRADTDMLFVGAIDERSVAKIIAQYEKEHHIEIRYTVMTEAEYRDRRHVMDKFLYSLFEGKHTTLVDLLHE